MCNNFSKKNQSKLPLDKNNSSKVSVDSKIAKDREFLIIDIDNNRESKKYKDFDPIMQSIIKLFEKKDILYHQLVEYADKRLSSKKNNGRYGIESEDLVYEVIEKLINGKLQWDMIEYSDPYDQVKYHIYWKTKKLYEKYEKMNGEKEFDDFTSQDLYKEGLCQIDSGDFDVKGIYQKLSEVKLIRHNQTIHVDEWCNNEATPFQKDVIDLKREGLKDQEIAAKLKAPVKNVYNVLKNNKGKFKDLKF